MTTELSATSVEVVKRTLRVLIERTVIIASGLDRPLAESELVRMAKTVADVPDVLVMAVGEAMLDKFEKSPRAASLARLTELHRWLLEAPPGTTATDFAQHFLLDGHTKH